MTSLRGLVHIPSAVAICPRSSPLVPEPDSPRRRGNAAGRKGLRPPGADTQLTVGFRPTAHGGLPFAVGLQPANRVLLAQAELAMRSPGEIVGAHFGRPKIPTMTVLLKLHEGLELQIAPNFLGI